MKIECSKEILIENINVVLKAVSSRTTLSILECILLIADDAGFRLLSNDLELGIETDNIEAEIIEKGSVALDSKIFSDIIKRLPGEKVEIEVKDKNITTIKSGKSEFKILGLSGEDFPLLPEVDSDLIFGMPSLALKDMIRQTIFSVSLDESKPIMTGELLELKNGVVRLVAVDGYRVSYRTFDIKSDFEDMRVVIPSKTMSEISKILSTDVDSEVFIFFTERHCLFKLKGCKVVSRLIEGDFINFEALFSDDCTTHIIIDRSSLLESIERAALISRDVKKNPVKFNISDSKMIITSNTEMGTSYDELPLEQDGVDLAIAFNPKFLTDIMRIIESERVCLQFTTPLSPCIIKGTRDNDNFRYLVLPLRIKG